MSTYEFYEFRALDRTLTKSEMDAVRQYSSRAEVSRVGFRVTYHYSSFSEDTRKILAQYFDVHAYVASWMHRRLCIRLPEIAARPDILNSYLTRYAVSWDRFGDYIVVCLSFQPEERSEWAEGEGWIERLLPVRDALIRGDWRPLYVGWLAGVEAGWVMDEETEPPVPLGLGDRKDDYLSDLCEFLCISDELLAAAAERSASLPTVEETENLVSHWVENQSAERRDHLLKELILGQQAGQGRALLAQAVSPAFARIDEGQRRSVSELRERATALRTARIEREEQERRRIEAEKRREEKRKRVIYLGSLVGREDELWRKVKALTRVSNPKKYDLAVELIVDLRDVARRQGSTSKFEDRLRFIRTTYSRRPSFIRRLDEKGLG